MNPHKKELLLIGGSPKFGDVVLAGSSAGAQVLFWEMLKDEAEAREVSVRLQDGESKVKLAELADYLKGLK